MLPLGDLQQDSHLWPFKDPAGLGVTACPELAEWSPVYKAPWLKELLSRAPWGCPGGCSLKYSLLPLVHPPPSELGIW